MANKTITRSNRLLLDNAETRNAWAAYSIRKLTIAYKGPCMRVRRLPGNEEKDIYFGSSGVLDIDTLLEFTGSYGDAYVVKWYDQSGNGRDVSQATLNVQPQIVSSGVMWVLNNKPAIRFLTGNTNLELDATYNLGTEYSFIGRMSFASTNGGSGVEWLGAGPNMYGFYLYPSTGPVAHGLNGTFWNTAGGSIISLAQPHSIMIFRQDLTASFFVDNNVYGNDPAALIGSTNLNFELRRISGESGTSYWFDGYMQETIIFTDNIKANRSVVENDMDKFYTNKITDDLVSFWSFDNQNSLDSMNRAHGINSNVTFESSTVSPNRIKFNGNSSVTVGDYYDYAFIQNTGVFTISFWVQPTDYTTPQYFMGNGGDDNYQKGFYIGIESAPGQLRMYMVNGTGTQMINATVPGYFGDNSLFHVVIVGNGSGLVFYRNAISVASPNFGTKSTGSSTGLLTLGKIYNFGPGATNAALDEIGIWRRALTQTEITQLYNIRK